MQKTVSIIIPNYNGRHLLAAYLPSVFEASKLIMVDYEIIIVDDCSKDDSVLFIQNNYPTIKLLINEENKGFSFTCNQGIKSAVFELILLLNSDVRLSPDYFRHQWQYFADEQTFGVMGRIMSSNGDQIEDAARLLCYKGIKIKGNKFYYTEDENDVTVLTAYLSGANALVDAKKLKELGGFDEIYSPFSSEDFDLSLRAWLLGWKCYYEHNSVCYHQISGSTKTQLQATFINKIYYRNRFVFLAIQLEGARLSVLNLYLIFAELIPKLIIGKFWIWQSYKQYLALKYQIRLSRSKLSSLKSKYHSKLQVKDIISIINQSIARKT